MTERSSSTATRYDVVLIGVDPRREGDQTRAALASCLGLSPSQIASALRRAPQPVVTTRSAEEGARWVAALREAGAYARLEPSRAEHAESRRSGTRARIGVDLSGRAAEPPEPPVTWHPPQREGQSGGVLGELRSALDSLALTAPVRTPPSLTPPRVETPTFDPCSGAQESQECAIDEGAIGYAPDSTGGSMAEEDAGKASSKDETVALLREIRDLNKAQYETQKQFLFVLLPIFALMTIMTILGLTGFF